MFQLYICRVVAEISSDEKGILLKLIQCVLWPITDSLLLFSVQIKETDNRPIYLIKL